MLISAKEEAKAIIDRLPEEVTIEDIQYHFYVLEKVRKSRETMAKGGVMSQAEAEEKFAEWRRHWK